MFPQIQECIDYFKFVCLNDLDADCWVAGGALREYFTTGNAKRSDVDIFFPSKTECEKAKANLLAKNSKITFENDRIINFVHKRHKIQLIMTRYFPGPEDTIAEFDFTACCAAVDKNDVYVHPTFFMDIAKKRLVINALPFPLSTMQRMQRYIQKGYTICNQGLLTLAQAIAKVDFADPVSNNIEFYPDGKAKFVRFD